MVRGFGAGAREIVGSGVAERAVSAARMGRIGHAVAARGGQRSRLKSRVLRPGRQHRRRHRVGAHTHPHGSGLVATGTAPRDTGMNLRIAGRGCGKSAAWRRVAGVGTDQADRQRAEVTALAPGRRRQMGTRTSG